MLRPRLRAKTAHFFLQLNKKIGHGATPLKPMFFLLKLKIEPEVIVNPAQPLESWLWCLWSEVDSSLLLDYEMLSLSVL